jgi:tetratricopeptide (TPR) repeat protein
MASVSDPGLDGRAAAHPERLDGWKSIAAYLKRDRTTVIRWTRERGLPVHRLPGGQTGTVFALKHELDNWAGVPGASFDFEHPAPADPPPVIAPVVAETQQGQPRQRRLVTGLAALGLAIGVTAVVASQKATPNTPPPLATQTLVLPHDPATATRFLAARDLIADRKAAGLERAIRLLEDVIRVAPEYAPGHATLAEALLLSREFGRRADVEAFAAARRAAQSAVRLAPDMAMGHRMLGFLAYWADRDFAQADAHFRRALSLDPDDACSHFWYGNILSDHGNHAAGLRALNQARLLQPGSVAIATDLAWAQWAAGQDAEAKASLTAIVEDHPDFAVAFDALSIVSLSEGDYQGYAKNFSQYATLKQDARLVANAQAVEQAMRVGPVEGRQEIMRQALAETVQDQTRSHAWSALVASAIGDRAQMGAIMRAAEQRKERWDSAGFRLHIERSWRQDREILAALARRKPQPGLQT